jgi:hypothetical protein
MTAPQPISQAPQSGNVIRAGFGIDQQNPAACRLRLESGNGAFELLMDTASILPFLDGIRASVAQQIDAAPKLTRPPSGLFLPDGVGLPRVNGNG